MKIDNSHGLIDVDAPHEVLDVYHDPNYYSHMRAQVRAFGSCVVATSFEGGSTGTIGVFVEDLIPESGVDEKLIIVLSNALQDYLEEQEVFDCE